MTRRIAAVVAVTGILSACAGHNQVPPAPGMPSIAAIEATAGQLAATKLSPADFAVTGYLLNAENCHAYFEQLADRAAKLALAGQENRLGGGFLSGILGLAGVGAAPVAGVSLLSSLVGGSLSANGASPIPYPVETAQLVRQALSSYLSAASIPSSLPNAALLVEGESWLCSLPGAEWLSRQAVATATTTAAGPTSGITAHFELPRAVQVPPSISVRH